MIDLLKLAIECKEISDTRVKNGSVGSDILKHCAGEVIEATEARDDYLNFVGEEEDGKDIKNNYGFELADIIICCLISFADSGMNPEEFIYKKIKINKLRAEGNGDKL